MICIIAGNRKEAELWASANQLDPDEWFYPYEPSEIKRRENFHVIVIGSAGENVPAHWFENVYNLAKQYGRRNRK